MSTSTRLEGVLAPVVTPFKPDYAPDASRFVKHCQWLLDSGCAGLAVFGTNSEANSLSVNEKTALLDALVGSGVPAHTLMPGTGASSLTDAITMTAHAAKLGCGGVLMLPPFFYKGVSDEGLFRYYSTVIETVASDALQVYLYHIPPVSQVGISLKLVERLLKAYPKNIAGLKDSSGDWSNTKALLDEFSKSGFDVFAGSEVFLLDNMRHGGKGCITATGNVNPGAIANVYRNWQTAEADALQQGITSTRELVQKYSMIPALKAIIADFSGDSAWRTVRPPLVELPGDQEAEMLAKLKATGFTMPGLRG